MTQIFNKKTKKWLATIRWDDHMVDYDHSVLEVEE